MEFFLRSRFVNLEFRELKGRIFSLLFGRERRALEFQPSLPLLNGHHLLLLYYSSTSFLHLKKLWTRFSDSSSLDSEVLEARRKLQDYDELTKEKVGIVSTTFFSLAFPHLYKLSRLAGLDLKLGYKHF